MSGNTSREKMPKSASTKVEENKFEIAFSKWEALWEEWDRADKHAAFDVGQMKSVEEVVDWLFRIGKRCLVSNLRYYYVYGTRGIMLVNTAGHDEDLAEQLRYGFRLDRSLKTLTSFYWYEIGKPVVCKVDPEVDDVEPGKDLSESVAFAKVSDSCGAQMRSEGDRLYIDIPVFLEGKPVIKFSCDFCVSDPGMLDVEEVEQFCRFAQLAGHVLYALQENDSRKRRQEERTETEELGSTREIGAYVEARLPKLFKCESASFFLLRRDTNESQDTLQTLIRVSVRRIIDRLRLHYIIDRRSQSFLIPMVANRKRTLIFDDLENGTLRSRQSEEYGLHLKWKDSVFDDWRGVSNVMAVPVLLPASNELLGVLVFLNKVPPAENRDDLAYFNWLDCKLAEWIANECLAPRIKFLQSNSQQRWDPSVFPLKDVSRLYSSDDIWQVLLSMLECAIPEGDSRKLYAVCDVSKNLTTLSVSASQGKLDNHLSQRNGIPLRDTVTLAAIQEKKNGVVYRNVQDLRGWITPNAVCEMGCAIKGPNGNQLALVVKSDTYDLSPEVCSPALRWLASWMSQILQGRDGGPKCSTH